MIGRQRRCRIALVEDHDRGSDRPFARAGPCAHIAFQHLATWRCAFWRIRIAAMALPSTKAGNDGGGELARKSSDGGTKPEAGSQPS